MADEKIVDMHSAKRKKARPNIPKEVTAPELTANHTDIRNAEHFVEQNVERLRYCATWGLWLAWHEAGVWRKEPTRAGLQQEAAMQVGRRLNANAARAYNAAESDYKQAELRRDDAKMNAAQERMLDARDKLGKVRRAQSKAGIDAMIALAASSPYMAIDHHKLDFNEMALNTPTGVADLGTGALVEHNKEGLHTKLAGAGYDPNAKCPLWDAFLLRAMGGDTEMVGFLQKLVGYALTGSTREHILVFHYGTGANGKSVFLNTIHKMLGDYATPAPRNLLFRSKSERHPTELTTLHGARFVTCNEIEEGLMWDEGLVKDLTSSDPIEARRMRENFWSFDPTHKLHIAGNHKPQVRGDDEGIWRRMRLIPWAVVIPEGQRDHDLPKKLEGELSGILAWAVSGCLSWQKNGMVPPKAVTDATLEYRKDNDIVGQFLEEKVQKDAGCMVSVKDLREAYEAFSKEMGAHPLGGVRFNARIRGAGGMPGQSRQATGTTKVWRGIRLL